METEATLNDKWNIHKTIQEALKSAHNEPSPQTMEMFKEQNKQLSSMSTDIAVIKQRGVDRDASIEEIKGLIKETNTSVKDVASKVAIQNGKTSKLEIWSNEAQKIIESSAKGFADYRVDKAKIWVAIALLTALGGTIIGLSVAAIDSKIKAGIETALANVELQGKLQE